MRDLNHSPAQGRLAEIVQGVQRFTQALQYFGIFISAARQATAEFQAAYQRSSAGGSR
jgi:hypothetical protein